jgi:predicted signal transduction protein with EAL and GGDEF domain
MSAESDSEQLQRLNRTLDRERRARLQAESVAERGLRELFVRKQEILLLERISELANSTGSLAETMPSALERLCAFAGWPLGRLLLVDRPEESRVELRASGLWNPVATGALALLPPAVDALPLLPGVGVGGRVVETGCAAQVVDFRQVPVYAPLSAIAPAHLQAIVGFPVLAGAEVVAVLEFFTTSIEPVPESLQRLMGHLGTQLGRIVERQRSRETLIDAFRDPLTRLPNRTFFHRALARAFRKAQMDPAYRFAVLFADLDGFKIVNDSLGHGAGDELVVQIARRLTDGLRREDTITRGGPVEPAPPASPTIARLGGDEFTILLDDVQHPDDAMRIARRMQEGLQLPFVVEGHEIFASASIGIAMSEASYTRAEDILRDADVAMYRAKSQGKGRSVLFDPAMGHHAAARMQLETDIRYALRREQLRLRFQPVVSLVHGRVVALEALLRWQHPERGSLVPAEFLEIAEETGVIVAFTEWILAQSVGHLERWQQTLPEGELLAICVNLSARQFLAPDLVPAVERIVRGSAIVPGTLRLELTDASTQDVLRARDIVQALRGIDVSVSLDDFGTGGTALASLAHLPVTSLKMDRTFIGELDANVHGRTVMRSVVGLAHRLGIEVVAEGVESAEEVEHLLAIGCPLAQGYYFSAPVDPDDVPATLARVSARLTR